MSEEKIKTKEQLIKDIIYCALGAKSSHNDKNYGDEEQWIHHMYNYLSEYLDNNYDIEE